MKFSDIELLSPVGDFECLKAAVQNGADSVYFGATSFSARASASNFDENQLKEAIQYASLRGVKTHLTLNTLIKNNEIEEALLLAKKAYEFGISAIIVQDLGLAKTLVENFPDLPIHASTQMTLHNLDGVLEVQKLGFKRAVLSRELSLEEITYICSHSDIEIETFIHGALCVSYSGQCLFSSMIGGRSGNRGRCAQPCRLPYDLMESDHVIDKGYLLSTRDFCGLDFLPDLIKSGVMCFKIEGRMKNPEYVATVTRIYRKYIDLALSDKSYFVEEKDKKELMQVFNRGNFSSGHLSTEPNQNLVFKEKQNHMGLYLGNVSNFKESKGHVFINLDESLSIGDSISFEKESGKYTVSELMLKEKNFSSANKGDYVEVGRMKGNINPGDKVYKVASKELTTTALSTLEQENKKLTLEASIVVKKDFPVTLTVKTQSTLPIYENISITKTSSLIPLEAKSKPIDKERIFSQLSKTNNTIFEFKKIDIDLEDNLFLPSIGSLNELRREVLSEILEIATKRIERNSLYSFDIQSLQIANTSPSIDKPAISVLLNLLSTKEDYTKLEQVDNIYVPIKYFLNKDFSSTLHSLEENHKLYIYLPTIIKPNFSNIILDLIENAITEYTISGFVISNISGTAIASYLKKKYKERYEMIANYTMNIFNSYTEKELLNLGTSKLTLSLELNKSEIENLCTLNSNVKRELIVYGRTPLMTSAYCLLGKSNKCYPTCPSKCGSQSSYYLKDRLNFNFKVIPDNLQTVTTIYNSRITSLDIASLSQECLATFSSFRIDVLEEPIQEINKIVSSVLEKKRLEGTEYTNGNFGR